MLNYEKLLYRLLILPFENSIAPMGTEKRHVFVFVSMHVHGQAKKS